MKKLPFATGIGGSDGCAGVIGVGSVTEAADQGTEGADRRRFTQGVLMPRWARTALMIVVMVAAIVGTAGQADATSPLPSRLCQSIAPRHVVQTLSGTAGVSCAQARAVEEYWLTHRQTPHHVRIAGIPWQYHFYGGFTFPNGVREPATALFLNGPENCAIRCKLAVSILLPSG